MSIFQRSGGFLISLNWGRWCLVCLYISLLSGIIVGLQYDYNEPFYSVTALDTLIPYGDFFRSLHFYSSQLFFLLAVIHYSAVFRKSDEYTASYWALLVLSLPIILFLLFTGYVLRGDATGSSAGAIAEHILLSVPLIGRFLNATLFSISEHGLQRVYLHHVISFDLLLLVVLWDHLRRYFRLKTSDYLLLFALLFLFCAFVYAPLDPDELGRFYITGPWFFLGLQELLRSTPPFIAGFLVPVFFIILLLILRRNSSHRSLAFITIAVWLICYLCLSLLALFAHT